MGIVEIATKREGEKLKERVDGVVEGKGAYHLHNHRWNLVRKHKTILVIVDTTAAPTLACEQALWGALAAGREKEGGLAAT